MTVSVYGLGRFGAYWASVLANDFKVKGYSRSSSRPTPEGVERVDLEELYNCDVLFISTSISSVKEVVANLAKGLKPGTLVMDTCSVKVYPVKVMQNLFKKDIEIIATHPMFGPDSGKNGVEGLPIVYSPVRCSKENEKFWFDYFEGKGMVVETMTPEQHDKEAAYTQGITHFVGRILDKLELEDSNIATKGYIALQEIVKQTCNDPWQLFLDLQSYNPYTAEMRNKMDSAINDMVEMFDNLKKSEELDG